MQPTEILNQIFCHESFRGQQEKIITTLLQGDHALVIMPTGGGKSICYQVPALSLASKGQGMTLVISPLIALMKDQVDSLKQKRVRAAFINSSLTREKREASYTALEQGGYDLLYVTPERFRKPEFLNAIGKQKIALLAVDEAHCISQWGHDFRPDYTRLQEIREILGHPVTVALTATATREVQQDIVNQLGLTSKEVGLFHEGIDRPNLDLQVEQVWGAEEKLDRILHTRTQYQGPGIIYFSLIRSLEAMSEMLDAHRVEHLVYHGKLNPRERRALQEAFMQGDDRLVLATNAFGMGIDKQNIRFVLHAEVPGSMESYYQEIGRAGRDQRHSLCLLLYDESDLATQMEFIQWSNPDAEFCHRVYEYLQRDAEKIHAFGQEWLRDQLHFKNRHDFRMETVLQLFDRYGVIEGSMHPLHIEHLQPMPPALTNPQERQDKLLRDQKKLHALLEYVKYDGDRKAFIHEYFGLPYGRPTIEN
ncbi:MAG: RecQ family ATP-dependent DNA helicase [Planctomycetota bacterium]|nr:RecQ family ATP-dependent DNA helicase [Planctomycetota bacterium]MEC8337261.1 RecQ family ATP-dependent DNA helicase [Planctomycetota bacterium]